jgi:hypothetical protein
MKYLKPVRVAGLCLAAGMIGAAPATLADGSKSKAWSLDLKAGIMFDDRVTVDEADASAASDVAAVFDIDASYKLVNESDARVEIGYDFYQSLYSDLSDFNWQEHSPSITAWTKALGGVKLGITYAYTYASLGGSHFYGQHALTPSLSANIADDMQLILSYRYYDKDYEFPEDARDATGNQVNADLYVYFSENKKGFVQFGAGYTDEATRGEVVSVLPGPVLVPTDPYDYSGFTARAAVQVPIDPFGLPGRVKLSYSYQMRDYDDPTSLFPALPPAAGLPTRQDDRQTLRALADVEVADNLKLYADYRFSDRGSNLATADYNKNVVSMGLEYGF